MTFKEAVEFILAEEGGWVNDKNDPGGETNFGISKRSYPHLDIYKLTRDEAIQIYHDDFWDKHHLHLFPPGLNLMFFDCALNQGPVNAIKFLQKAIHSPVTGKLVFSDIEKLTEVDLDDVMREFVFARAKHYSDNKNYIRFGKGWLNRLIKTTVAAIYASKKSAFPSLG